MWFKRLCILEPGIYTRRISAAKFRRKATHDVGGNNDCKLWCVRVLEPLSDSRESERGSSAPSLATFLFWGPLVVRGGEWNFCMEGIGRELVWKHTNYGWSVVYAMLVFFWNENPTNSLHPAGLRAVPQQMTSSRSVRFWYITPTSQPCTGQKDAHGKETQKWTRTTNNEYSCRVERSVNSRRRARRAPELPTMQANSQSGRPRTRKDVRSWEFDRPIFRKATNSLKCSIKMRFQPK